MADSLADIFADRKAASKHEGASDFRAIAPEPQKIETLQITLKPTAKSWEDLEAILKDVVNLSGMWRTVRALYEQGRGAELETAAEIALARNRKTPFQYFCGMVSKKSGNWETQTLKTVEETWRVRQNALQLMEKLKLEAKSTGYILGLCWKFKDTIIRFLGIATEQGYGIKNPAGYFFGIIKTVTAST